MNVDIRDRALLRADAISKPAIADCDIHPYPKGAALYEFLEPPWRDHLKTYGKRQRQGYLEGPAFPKGQPDAARRDAYPPDGGKPGSDLGFMRAQHLDPNNVVFGILNPLRTGQGLQNLDFAAALCRATNEWQVAEWTSQESRLKASVVVPYEDAAASAAEIDRWAGHPDFAQVLLLSPATGRSTRRRSAPTCPSAFTPSATAAIRSLAAVGPRFISRKWSAMRNAPRRC
jgi:predicted TIM-barrel fold metal-dependent hydrolase